MSHSDFDHKLSPEMAKLFNAMPTRETEGPFAKPLEQLRARADRLTERGENQITAGKPDEQCLAEARVDADQVAMATERALAADGDLLSTDERAAIDAALGKVRALRDGGDADTLRHAVEALNRATETFAARRMDRGVRQALAGRAIDTLA